MSKRDLLAACVCLTAWSCDVNQNSHVVLPTTPSTVAQPPPVDVPPPHQFPPLEITTIEVGEVVNQTNTDAPECMFLEGWPCLYYRITVPRSGALDVSLSYAKGTQGAQAVDVSLLVGVYREVKAQFFDQSGTRVQTGLTADVVGGRTYIITLWYTFPNLAYELRVQMR